ncbi:MAG: hypothetical protein HC852_11670 [Acaryochloridaceae cyanobacterium RU_4_10]|nr:hypothetical protein [Acaryochloridaceae cyanobacterium RU_4_10]
MAQDFVRGFRSRGLGDRLGLVAWGCKGDLNGKIFHEPLESNTSGTTIALTVANGGG